MAAKRNVDRIGCTLLLWEPARVYPGAHAASAGAAAARVPGRGRAGGRRRCTEPAGMAARLGACACGCSSSSPCRGPRDPVGDGGGPPARRLSAGRSGRSPRRRRRTGPARGRRYGRRLAPGGAGRPGVPGHRRPRPGDGHRAAPDAGLSRPRPPGPGTPDAAPLARDRLSVDPRDPRDVALRRPRACPPPARHGKRAAAAPGGRVRDRPDVRRGLRVRTGRGHDRQRAGAARPPGGSIALRAHRRDPHPAALRRADPGRQHGGPDARPGGQRGRRLARGRPRSGRAQRAGLPLAGRGDDDLRRRPSRSGRPRRPRLEARDRDALGSKSRSRWPTGNPGPGRGPAALDPGQRAAAEDLGLVYVEGAARGAAGLSSTGRCSGPHSRRSAGWSGTPTSRTGAASSMSGSSPTASSVASRGRSADPASPSSRVPFAAGSLPPVTATNRGAPLVVTRPTD